MTIITLYVVKTDVDDMISSVKRLQFSQLASVTTDAEGGEDVSFLDFAQLLSVEVPPYFHVDIFQAKDFGSYGSISRNGPPVWVVSSSLYKDELAFPDPWDNFVLEDGTGRLLGQRLQESLTHKKIGVPEKLTIIVQPARVHYPKSPVLH